MENKIYLKWVWLMVGMAFLLIPVQSLARDGWYMGIDVGGALEQGLKTRVSDNDYPSTCDQFITGTTDCSGFGGGDSWKNKFDAGVGILAGSTLGYRWRNFRVEGEYFYRNVDHNSREEVDFGLDPQLKAVQELVTQEETISNVSGHNFFANLYYDFTSDSKWTPYLGFGVGFARTSLEYSNRFTRNTDPAGITTFDNSYSNADDLNRRLAGTSTVGRSELSDTMFGYQAIAGMDYRISEPITIGLKFRWVDFGAFKGGDEYRQLRSHDSTNSLIPGDPRSGRVKYSIATDDIAFWALSLNIKYHF